MTLEDFEDKCLMAFLKCEAKEVEAFQEYLDTIENLKEEYNKTKHETETELGTAEN